MNPNSMRSTIQQGRSQEEFLTPRKVQDIINMRPATLPDQEVPYWIHFVDTFGLRCAYIISFGDYLAERWNKGVFGADWYLLKLFPYHFVPLYFGKIGSQAYKCFPRDHFGLRQYLTRCEWPLEDLGEFGHWVLCNKISYSVPDLITCFFDNFTNVSPAKITKKF